jgi:hypothetical protein
VLDHDPVQDSPPHADGVPVRKRGRYRVPAVNEPDASKRESFRRTQLNSERAQRCPAIRHQSFTASFVDRRAVAVSDNDVQSFPARGDCCGQPTGPAANYENVSLQSSPAE